MRVIVVCSGMFLKISSALAVVVIFCQIIWHQKIGLMLTFSRDSVPSFFTKFQLLGPRSPGDTSPYQSHYSLQGEQFRFQLVSLKDSKNLNSMVSLYLYIFIRSASGHWNNDLTVQQNMPQNN